MALMIGCIWHGLDALQGTRAKPGNHLVINKCILQKTFYIFVIITQGLYSNLLTVHMFVVLICSRTEYTRTSLEQNTLTKVLWTFQ